MSKFIVNQIVGRIRELFERYIDASDLNKEKDASYDDKITTRCLAAFAVASVAGATAEEAGRAVTDGGDDNGIDAVFYNKERKRLTLVQSKFIKDGTSEPPADEVRAFRDGVNDFLDGNIEKFNNKIRLKKEELSAITQFGVKCDIVLVYTGKTDLAKHASDIISEMIGDLNGTKDISQDSVFTFHKLCRERIFDRLAKFGKTASIELTFHLKEWGKVEAPHLSYYGRIYGSKIGEWWEQYGDDLLQDNIRKMLGSTDVNSQIAETAEKSPELFWYFNNGITVLAEKIEKSAENRDNRDFGFFKATNASVVNGAQTVSVIGWLAKRGVDLAKLEIPFRVISLGGDNELKKEITRTNNTQNTILAKDFIAQDPLQESLQKQVAILKYQYQVKRDDSFKPSAFAFDLDEAIESLIYTQNLANLSATFRKEIGRFYISDKAPYKILFNPRTSGYRLINAITFSRNVKNTAGKLLTELSSDQQYGRKAQILTNGVILLGQLVYKEMAISDSNINELLYNWDKKVISEKVEEVSSKIMEYCEDRYKANYLRTLFQNVTKCEDIFANALTPALTEKYDAGVDTILGKAVIEAAPVATEVTQEMLDLYK